MSAAEPLLAHRLEGARDGEAVLLLNGGMMTFATWEPVADRLLAAGLRTLRCDLLGQLLTPGTAHAELEGHVADVVRLLDHLEIDAVHVLGTSFGGEVGLLLAATRPERVSTLAAVTATDYATPELLQGIDELRATTAEVLEGGDRGRVHDLLIAEVYSDAYRRRHRQELADRRSQIGGLPEIWFRGLEGILACMEDLDLRPHLGDIRCPTLVVTASGDAVLPPERSRALADEIADAELVEHAESGHALVAEDPEWLAAVYLDFLSRAAARRSDRGS